MIFKLAVAGALGATLYYLFAGKSCTSSPAGDLATGFAIGAGVQAGVMILGVS